jgi:Mitochondrial carrier protein
MTKDDMRTGATSAAGTTPFLPSTSQPLPQELPLPTSNPNDVPRKQQLLHPSAIPMIGGFMGGVVSTTLLLPLDIIKLRLQVTESTSTDPNRKYRNFRALRIIGGIIKYEGIAGLYQGLTPAVLGSSISWGGYFFFYENFKQLYVRYKNKNQSKSNSGTADLKASTVTTTANLTSVDNFILACTSGAIMVVLTNPIWLIKTRMQLQMKRAQQQQQQLNSSTGKNISMIKPYDNMLDAVRTIIREEGGIKALYKGSGPALLLTSHGGVQFVVYEYLRKHYQSYFLSNSKTSNDTDNKHHHPSRNNRGWTKLQQSAGYLTMGAVAKM